MKTAFSYNLRVLACHNCGAPLETSLDGGTLKCTYCDTENTLVSRNDEPVEPVAVTTPVDENQRLVMLMQQDGTPMIPPASIQGLLQGGVIAAWKVPEAISVWQSTRRELESSANYEAAERLLFLTIMLANYYSEQNNPLQQRAMFESALEVFTIPRHRQMMRGYLARYAALQSDLEAAERWLGPCNPRSMDLQADSAYRITRATIDTARSDWNAVLGTLGAELGQVPIMDAMDAIAVLLRANALEQLGGGDAASSQIARYLATGGASGRAALSKVSAAYARSGWQLCPASFALANASYAQKAGKVAAARAGGGIGWPFLIIGTLMFLGTLVFVGLALTTAPQLMPALPGVGGGVGITGFVFMILGLAFVLSGRKAHRLRTTGVEASGQVVGLEPTNVRVNGVPQYRVTLNVQMPQRAPYQAATKVLLNPMTAMQLVPGAVVPLRVDPNDPNQILIEME